MQGLTILITTDDRVRFRAALSLACAQAALGGRVRIFCQEEAAVLLANRPDADADRLQSSGLADIPALIDAARDIGVELIVCQSGLSAARLGLDVLIPGVESGGVIGILATLGEDRLVIA